MCNIVQTVVMDLYSNTITYEQIHKKTRFVNIIFCQHVNNWLVKDILISKHIERESYWNVNWYTTLRFDRRLFSIFASCIFNSDYCQVVFGNGERFMSYHEWHKGGRRYCVYFYYKKSYVYINAPDIYFVKFLVPHSGT